MIHPVEDAEAFRAKADYQQPPENEWATAVLWQQAYRNADLILADLKHVRPATINRAWQENEQGNLEFAPYVDPRPLVANRLYELLKDNQR